MNKRSKVIIKILDIIICTFISTGILFAIIYISPFGK
ncbi:MAG: hypothetical protein K0R09_3155 [Clostridiales bacterium]|jgi:hypothetical protein|nr:hypothetical protein [Clostridiales bacterium]